MVIKITTRNQKRKIITGRSWFGYIELVSEDISQAAGKFQQASENKGRRLLDVLVSSTDVGGVGTGLLLRPWQWTGH